jgi:hypothetical protein
LQPFLFWEITDLVSISKIITDLVGVVKNCPEKKQEKIRTLKFRHADIGWVEEHLM